MAQRKLHQNCELYACLAVAVLGCAGAAPPPRWVAAPPAELELLAALPIDGPEDFQPSGLWVEHSHLLVVSDKHGEAIYELGLEAERAVARPFARFEPPPDVPDHLDMEAISGDGAGGFLIASESAFRVARIERRPGSDAGALAPRAVWITPSLRAAGEAAGCFRAQNAGFEGLARLDSRRLLLAVERQPRALMEVTLGSPAPELRAQPMPDSIYGMPRGRPPDFGDLFVADGRLYALVRNGHLVVRLERRGGTWVEGQGASYAAAENDPRYAYTDATYGLGEGLALTADRIFVVLDNNGQARRGTPADTRPLLFMFRRPPGF